LTEGPGPTSRPGSLPAPRVACRCPPVGFDRQHSPNLSKPYVACTFEFLISATPYLQTHHLGVSLGGRSGKTPTIIDFFFKI
jgi:hypothetical protein